MKLCINLKKDNNNVYSIGTIYINYYYLNSVLLHFKKSFSKYI